MKKTEQISEVYPKPAIQTAGIEPPIHQRIVTLAHHAALTPQTVHRLRLSSASVSTAVDSSPMPSSLPIILRRQSWCQMRGTRWPRFPERLRQATLAHLPVPSAQRG